MYLPGFFQDPYVEDTFEVVWPFASSGQLCRQVRRSKDMAMGLVSGRVAIVTGAAQGIGASYAKALAREGAKLCVSDIADCDDTVQQIRAGGAEAIGMRCDVTKSEDVSELVSATERTFGQIDILVNNAAMFGSLTLKPFEQIEASEWDLVMSVNVRGSFECIKGVLPVMKRRRYGKIVNIASGTIFKGTPMMAHYVASKGAIVALTRALARELGDTGILCNCLAPGLTMSESVRSKVNWSEFVSTNIASRSLKREMLPDDLVGALLFLVGPQSDFMTGQTIVIDGGSVFH